MEGAEAVPGTSNGENTGFDSAGATVGTCACCAKTVRVPVPGAVPEPWLV